MRRPPRHHPIPILLLPLVCGASLPGCPYWAPEGFVAVSEHGFEAEDNAEDLNDYPWAMAYFVPDGAETGDLYAATGNGILNLVVAGFGVPVANGMPTRPPEIRRYRPDLGAKTWERVLDYRDVETGPPWKTTGFRGLAAYRALSDGVKYLYAGTVSDEPALWRSTTGDPGSWQQVWTAPISGSIRGFAVHNGLLYFSMSLELFGGLFGGGEPGRIYATDGDDVWLVVGDGFGNPNNNGIYELISFNDWLFAGTSNPTDGCEVWKLEGPDGNTEPVQILSAGGTEPGNLVAGTMYVFQEKLYIGTLILAGFNPHNSFRLKGADLFRLDTEGNLEVVVGPGSVAGVESGFGKKMNAYFWSLAEHQGRLYCGTFHSGVSPRIAQARLVSLQQTIETLKEQFWIIGPTPFLDLVNDYIESELVRVATSPVQIAVVDALLGSGAELWVSDDGAHWGPVFTDGLDTIRNYGVRNLVSVGDDLFIGMANPLDGLIIWQYHPPAP